MKTEIRKVVVLGAGTMGAQVAAHVLAQGVEVALLDGGRAWVLIATSTARTRVPFVAQLPADVPPALWVSLIDGGTMSTRRTSSSMRSGVVS